MRWTSPFKVFCGAFTYEFRMQLRRRSLWITMLLLEVLLVALSSRHEGLEDILKPLRTARSSLIAAALWADALNFLIIPVGLGILVSDRLPRDRRTRVDELFNSTASSLGARLYGKYLGSVLATLVPLLPLFCLGVGYMLAQRHDPLVILLSLLAFVTINLPGLLFIGAFSIAFPAFIWPPLYWFLLTGYWLWGNELLPDSKVPTLSGTLLSPKGSYMSSGFFDAPYWVVQHATPLQGFESLGLLLGSAILAIAVLWGLLKWRAAHQ